MSGTTEKIQPYWKWQKSMGVHACFEKASEGQGIQIWRVEKMKLVAVPKENFGTFFTGDAYLVLHRDEDRAHLHIWHGEKASSDEKGASALFATQLDDSLQGRPVQHREAQGNESDVFMSYFPKGIKYQEGGVESGFQKVPTAPASIRRLYHVKGKKNVRAKQTEMSWASFNTGDCFILDLGQTIYQWCGSQSNMFERKKAGEIACSIRDQERRGKSQLIIVQDGEEPAEMMEVLGVKPVLKEGNPQEDAQADKSHSQMASLAKVSDATGAMTLTPVSSQNPFAREMLQSEDCFVLDNGVCGKIYVWKGRRANSEEKRAALKVAEDVINQRKYPPCTQVEIIPEGLETAFFKQFFKAWN
ncbi:macrophage-capping protein-like [Carcharodon carcharias]|uniref:macrophage-capping protein-like n=1 Tax=Carcharodon carcharias TaxID=13397 RepID=UPI001B7EBFAF|nr:macrophage-capping protein-like [Carcharodon carcharias]